MGLGIVFVSLTLLAVVYAILHYRGNRRDFVAKHGCLTCDPENIKSILSTKFKDYSLGNRTSIMGPLLGKGIFVNDSEEWSHSRALLRPNFVRDQVADLGMLETHLKDLLALVPQDGTTVDLQELFLRFTIDSATEFLFGHSVHTLTMRHLTGVLALQRRTANLSRSPEFASIEARDPTPWTESLTLTLASAKGVQVALQRT
ncbi:hypothetical protein CFD26_103191 [Aspergillus turcosus]|uniref:Uncharacterized protein n=1 Tax=Aspergillus turcosus TaxID=1245748 RepID=A0A3R7F1V5_9EURO|nr:hypothetical protein CFD26_103191 [Aspergillus turcosus]